MRRHFRWHNQLLRDVLNFNFNFNFKRERKRERWHRNFSTHDFHTVETLCKGCYEEFQKIHQWGFEPAIPRSTALMSNHYTTYFPPKYAEIFIDIITKCYGMISISRERERERERERDAHTHTGTRIDTRFSHCWNTLQRLLWGIPKGSSTSFEPAIPRTTALLANHYTTYFPPKCVDLALT